MHETYNKKRVKRGTPLEKKPARIDHEKREVKF